MSKKQLRGDDSISLSEWLADLTYHEVHLFVMGFYVGLTDMVPKRRTVPDYEYIREDANRWYWTGAYAIAYLLKCVLVVTVLAIVFG